MDAPNPSATPTFASRTPLHIGAIGLKVRDLDRLTDYYRDVLGLAVLDRSQDGATLGAGGVALVHLEHRPDAKPDDTRTAGLYHTAFLVPTRADLARWILHVARNKVPLTGASDHAVSEAFYLDDPEGNGIEVYHDRPAETWEWTGDALEDHDRPARRRRHPARGAGQPRAMTARRTGCASATSICASATSRRAEAFYRDALGLDVTRRRARRILHVVGPLSPPHRRQCLAQRRRRPARPGPRRIVLVLARSRRLRRFERRNRAWRKRARPLAAHARPASRPPTPGAPALRIARA